MSSFFTIPKSRKRKDNDGNTSGPKSAAKRMRTKEAGGGARSGPTRGSRQAAAARSGDDESISSGSGDSSASGDEGYVSGEEEAGAADGEDERETAAEKRLRLAEAYLDKVRAEAAGDDEIGFDAAEIDRDLIAERLREDVAETKGRLYRFVAPSYDWARTAEAVQSDRGSGSSSGARTWFMRAHDAGPATAVAVSGDFAYVATKDLRILKWRIPPRDTKVAKPVEVNPEKGVPRTELSKSRRRKLRAKRKDEERSTTVSAEPKLMASTRGTHRRKKDLRYQHHTAPILCLACSPLGDLLVSGSADRRIIVWDAQTLEPKRVFTQHRAAVTGLAFRRASNQMFSASADRTIKVWSMDELAYVETLFGHQDEVIDVGALGLERCISVGGRDRTARVWKVVEETQLVFRGGGAAAEKESRKERKQGHNSDRRLERADKKAQAAYGEGSIDRVALVDDELFVTGSDNGSLSLWSVQKKKPAHVVPLAHGLDPQMPLDEAFADLEMEQTEVPGPPLPRSITALAVLPYADIVVSGSWDGVLRIWRITEDKKRLEPVAQIGGIAQSSSDGALPNGTIETNGDINHSGTQGLEEGTIIEDGAEALVDGDEAESAHRSPRRGRLDGVVNDLKIFERGDRGKESLVILAALGKEQRLGRWRKFGGKNGTWLCEVSKVAKQLVAGLANGSQDHE